MSRRKRRPGGERAPAGGRRASAGGGRRPASSRPSPAPSSRASASAAPPGPRLLADVAVLASVLAGVTGVAELAGAANLGVSLGIATIAFTLVLMYLMLKR